MADRRERWHVGKEIPLAVVITMILQAAAIVWFAAKMDNRIEVNTAAITRNLEQIEDAIEDIDSLESSLAAQNVINARLDVTMQNVNRTLESVSRHMEASAGR